MNPYYITGLVQADGSFFIAHEKRPSSKFGVRFRPKFSLTLHINSIQALRSVQSFFHNSGAIYYHKNKDAAELVLSSPYQLLEHLVPHFIKYPLYSEKKQAFTLFVYILNRLQDREGYSFETFISLLRLSFSLNASKPISQANQELLKSLSESANTKLNREPTRAQILENQAQQDGLDLPDQFIVGLIDGDGSFHINFLAQAQLDFGFHITGDISQKDLFTKIQKKFACGYVRIVACKAIRYQVDCFGDVCNVIIPFIDKYQLYTYKEQHFRIFKQVAQLVKNNSHKTDQGFLDIIDIAYDMNLHGKRRKWTKQEYIEK